METKRIVMTSTFYPPYHLGGDAAHVRMLRAELERRGHEVHVVHSLDAFRLKGGEVSGDPRSDARVHPTEGRFGGRSAMWTYLTGRDRRAERELGRLAAEVRPDWVHHHNISLLGAKVLSGSEAPKVYTAHDYWLICPRSDLMYLGRETCGRQRCLSCSLRTGRPPQLWRPLLMPEALRSIRLLISPSRYMAGHLRSFLGLEAEVLPNFAPAPRRSWPLGEHCSFVGVLERNKGLDLLLRAFEDEELGSLHVMGKGSMEAEVREEERRSSGRISYKGFLTGEDLWREVGASKALLCPSAGNENSPLACIEALALGVPLVVSGRGGLPELVEDPECGRVCELTPGSIADAVRSVTAPTARTKLGENAFIRYQRHHEPSSYVDRYLRLCEAMRDVSD